MKEEKMSGWEFGIGMTIGVVTLAVGTDLTGRIATFLYGEGPYICVGLAIAAYFFVIFIGHYAFNDTLKHFQAEIEKRLADHRRLLAEVTAEKRGARNEVELMRKNIEKQWALYEGILKRTEEALLLKSPATIETPQTSTQEAPRLVPQEDPKPQQAIETQVHAAIQEVVGGAP